MTLDPIKPYLPLVYIGAALIVGLVVVGHFKGDRKVKAERDAALAEVAAYAEAQTVNLSNIDNLKTRIDLMVEARRLETEAMDKAVADAAAAVESANTQLAAVTEELNDVYAKYPTARAWGNTGVDARVADRLPGGKARRR